MITRMITRDLRKEVIKDGHMRAKAPEMYELLRQCKEYINDIQVDFNLEDNGVLDSIVNLLASINGD